MKPWRWLQHVSPKRWHTANILHGATTQCHGNLKFYTGLIKAVLNGVTKLGIKSVCLPYTLLNPRHRPVTQQFSQPLFQQRKKVRSHIFSLETLISVACSKDRWNITYVLCIRTWRWEWHAVWSVSFFRTVRVFSGGGHGSENISNAVLSEPEGSASLI